MIKVERAIPWGGRSYYRDPLEWAYKMTQSSLDFAVPISDHPEPMIRDAVVIADLRESVDETSQSQEFSDSISPEIEPPPQSSNFSSVATITKSQPTSFRPEQNERKPSNGEVELINALFLELVEEEATEIALDCHTFTRLGLGFLKRDASFIEIPDSPRKSTAKKRVMGGRTVVTPIPMSNSPHTDIFGQPLASSSKQIKNQECICPKCDRNMAATRFAPHLEKCMGMGRNSYRNASSRRRAAAPPSVPAVVPSLASLGNSTRNSYRGSSGVIQKIRDDNLEESDDEDDDEGDEYSPDYFGPDDDDDDWLLMSRKRKTTRKKPAATTKANRKAPVLSQITSRPPADGILLKDLLDTPPSTLGESDPSLGDEITSFVMPTLTEEYNSHEMITDDGSGNPETMKLRSRRVKRPESKNESYMDTVLPHKDFLDDDLYILDD